MLMSSSLRMVGRTVIAFTALAATYGIANAYNGYHTLMIKARSNAYSAYVVYTNGNGNGATACVYNMTPNKWSGPFLGSKNGTKVTVQEFTSSNCTNGDLGKKTYTVPGADGLDNFWITY